MLTPIRSAAAKTVSSGLNRVEWPEIWKATVAPTQPAGATAAFASTSADYARGFWADPKFSR